jgi:hypothetical protein
MTAATVLGWLIITAVGGRSTHPEALFGLLGPLVSANVSWLVMVRAFAAGPERLMGVMVQALVVKMVLFGAYVTVMLRVYDVRAVPFVLSFAGSFIALYAMEALFLRRLLMEDARPPRG